ncbi:unnamed protein product [Caenorhabditis sp. 36 PRJEB53466]|nr:unnamed protein product [Caenorhabditis sp. 36 PRJEB53466]
MEADLFNNADPATVKQKLMEYYSLTPQATEHFITQLKMLHQNRIAAQNNITLRANEIPVDQEVVCPPGPVMSGLRNCASPPTTPPRPPRFERPSPAYQQPAPLDMPEFARPFAAAILTLDTNAITQKLKTIRLLGRCHLIEVAAFNSSCFLHKIVRELPRPNPENQEITALHARVAKVFELIKDYLDSNVDRVDSDGNTLLNLAIYTGQIEMAKELIDQGTRLNTYNRDRKGPLEIAVQVNNMALFEYLIQAGCRFHHIIDELRPRNMIEHLKGVTVPEDMVVVAANHQTELRTLFDEDRAQYGVCSKAVAKYAIVLFPRGTVQDDLKEMQGDFIGDTSITSNPQMGCMMKLMPIIWDKKLNKFVAKRDTACHMGERPLVNDIVAQYRHRPHYYEVNTLYAGQNNIVLTFKKSEEHVILAAQVSLHRYEHTGDLEFDRSESIHIGDGTVSEILKATNDTSERVGFSCTNAARHLKVTPANGVLNPSEEIELVVSYNPIFFASEDPNKSRFSIKWINAPADEQTYSDRWFDRRVNERYKTFDVTFN